jgi:hypothetical protein
MHMAPIARRKRLYNSVFLSRHRAAGVSMSISPLLSCSRLRSERAECDYPIPAATKNHHCHARAYTCRKSLLARTSACLAGELNPGECALQCTPYRQEAYPNGIISRLGRGRNVSRFFQDISRRESGHRWWSLHQGSLNSNSFNSVR